MHEIDEYIAGFPAEVQEILKEIRATIKTAAPEADESFAYGMPAYKTHGKPLIYFAAFKKHIGLYATPSGHAKFSGELSTYKQGKGSVQFPLEKPIPFDLIKKIVVFKATENAAKNAPKKPAKSKLTDQEQVADYLNKLDHPLKKVVQELRAVITAADPEIAEQIKWNAPSFYYKGDMKPFDPKEYKRDMVVFNLHKQDVVLLVFPTGANIQDPTGLLEGKFPDGRKTAKFSTVSEVVQRKDDLQKVLKLWIEVVDK